MSKPIKLGEIEPKVKNKVYIQDYSKKEVIEGVKIILLESYVGEEGDLSEVIKMDKQGYVEQLPGFKIAQINRTRLNAGSVKAWHLHLFQDEVWYLLPSDELFVGLWDIRRDSKTNGTTMRIVLGGGNSKLLFVPHGVAHGSANFTERGAELLYLSNRHFDTNNPDEYRLPWDSKGEEFWKPQRD